jgi:hypothetical protein
MTFMSGGCSDVADAIRRKVVSNLSDVAIGYGPEFFGTIIIMSQGKICGICHIGRAARTIGDEQIHGDLEP